MSAILDTNQTTAGDFLMIQQAVKQKLELWLIHKQMRISLAHLQVKLLFKSDFKL